jgi:hypothetical protein
MESNEIPSRSTQDVHVQGNLILDYYELLRAEARVLSVPESGLAAKLHARARDLYVAGVTAVDDAALRRHHEIVSLIHTRDATRRYPVLSDEFDRRFPGKKR